MQGEISVLNHEGDTKLIWDSENKVETKAARNMFDELKDKGYSAFAVKKDGEKGDRLTKFDPEEEKIIMAPPMRGG